MDKELDRPELSNYEYLVMLLECSKKELDKMQLTVAQRESTRPVINRLDEILSEYADYKSFFEKGK